MAKQVDVEKLFSEKLKSFELESTPQFDDLMEKKINKQPWGTYIKWLIGGIVLVGGLSFLFPSLLYDSSDSLTTPSTITTDLHLDSSQKSLQTEKVVSQKEEIKNEMENMNPSVEITSSNSTIDIEKEDFVFLEIQEPETQDQLSNFVWERTIPPQKMLRNNENISISYLKNPLPSKAKLYPTSLYDEKYAQKQKEKTKDLIPFEQTNSKTQISNGKENFSFSEENQQEVWTNNKKDKDKRVKVKKEKKSPRIKMPKGEKAGLFDAALEWSAAPIFVNNLSPPLEPKNIIVTNWLTNKNFKTSYDLGFEFLLKHKESNWLFKTGLHYQHITEDVNYYFLREYINEDLSHWVYDSIFEYHIDPPQFDTVLVGIDSSFYEHWVHEENAKKHSNHYQYLNIPILLGYQINFPNSHFDVDVLVGTGLGILLKSEGYYYNTDGYIHPYPKSQKAQVNWYLNTQLSINYHWKNISVFAKPKMQFQLQKREFEDYFENRQYLIFGFDFGVRVKIF